MTDPLFPKANVPATGFMRLAQTHMYTGNAFLILAHR